MGRRKAGSSLNKRRTVASKRAVIQVASVDIPQADRLPNFRRFALAIRDGIRHVATLQEYLGVDARHFNYYRQAAELLGLVERRAGDLHLTTLGEGLLASAEGSLDERAVFRQAIASADGLEPFASFFAGEDLSVNELGKRIEGLCDLAPSTAKRRARTLWRWRRYVDGEPALGPGQLHIIPLGHTLERIVAHHNAVAKQRVLDWLHQVPPDRFEHICAALLDAMGYEQVQVVGGSGDGGVDVRAVHSDRWGHEIEVAVQAKRWGRTIGRRTVDEMVGVIARARLGQAILMTTASFSKAGREAAASEARLRLVDGAQLVELMAAHGVVVGLGRHGEVIELALPRMPTRWLPAKRRGRRASEGDQTCLFVEAPA